jgi:hypothetical protein
MTDTTVKRLAVYWDFENMHASQLDAQYVSGTYNNGRGQSQPPVLCVQWVVDYLATIGDLIIHRAYADWCRFSKYDTVLLENAIELVQLFRVGMHGKNGADIHIAVDAIQDIHSHPGVTHVVILGGDSDYIAVAQALRRAGKVVLGIGGREATNHFWKSACHDFQYYEVLLETSEASAEPPTQALVESRTLLVGALKHLSTTRGQKWVPKSTLKPTMSQLDPTFDVSNAGFHSFVDFLTHCQDLIYIRPGAHDQLVALRITPNSTETPLEENGYTQGTHSGLSSSQLVSGTTVT